MVSREQLGCRILGQPVEKLDGAPGVRGCAHVLWGAEETALPAGRRDAAPLPFDVSIDGVFYSSRAVVFAGMKRDIEPLEPDQPHTDAWFARAVSRALQRYVIVERAEFGYGDALAVAVTPQEVRVGYCRASAGVSRWSQSRLSEVGRGYLVSTRVQAGKSERIALGEGSDHSIRVALTTADGAYAVAVHRAYFL